MQRRQYSAAFLIKPRRAWLDDGALHIIMLGFSPLKSSGSAKLNFPE